MSRFRSGCRFSLRGRLSSSRPAVARRVSTHARPRAGAEPAQPLRPSRNAETVAVHSALLADHAAGWRFREAGRLKDAVRRRPATLRAATLPPGRPDARGDILEPPHSGDGLAPRRRRPGSAHPGPHSACLIDRPSSSLRQRCSRGPEISASRTRLTPSPYAARASICLCGRGSSRVPTDPLDQRSLTPAGRVTAFQNRRSGGRYLHGVENGLRHKADHREGG